MKNVLEQWLIILLILPFTNTFSATLAQTTAIAKHSIFSAPVKGDNVQQLLEAWLHEAPDEVGFIPETGRYYLYNPRPEAVSEEMLEALHDAFYRDFHRLCRFYSTKYLVDWKVLLSKSARETFWGTSYLCNRGFNYFGIRRANKEWMCNPFQFCENIERMDPEPADFAIFPHFEASLWMFIHTIYSFHFLERLPDEGERVIMAIDFERENGIPFWKASVNGQTYSDWLTGDYYSMEEILYTWSGHPKNNLCVVCTPESDMRWIMKVVRAAERVRD